MRWDNILFLVLLAAFGMFITLRGELPVYLGFLLTPKSAPVPKMPLAATRAGAAPVAKEAAGIAGSLIPGGSVITGTISKLLDW